MPALLTHLTAVERLAAHATSLPPEFARALGEDLEYARFGAALPELPWFGGWNLGLLSLYERQQPPHFSTLFMDRAPVAFGLKAAELVANGALVGTEAGMAFIAGYFTQLNVARALEPIVQALMASHRKPSEQPHAARNRIDWVQSLFLMQELHGSPLVGTGAVRSKLHLRKASMARSIGRGLYELMRVSSQEAFGEAPTKREVDSWVLGMYVFSLALGSPLGKLKASPAYLAQRELYRAPGIDVFAAVDQGLDKTREVLSLLSGMIRRNSFGARSRYKLFEICPEGAPSVVMRPDAA